MSDFLNGSSPNLNFLFLEKAYRTISDWWSGDDQKIHVAPNARVIAQEIKDRYNVAVTIPTTDISQTSGGGYKYSCTPIPENEQEERLAELQKEMSKVPPQYFKSVLVQDITICRNIQLDSGMSVEFVDGLTDKFHSNAMALDLMYSFHHEMFHAAAQPLKFLVRHDSGDDIYEKWAQLDPATAPTLLLEEDMAEHARYLFNLNTVGGQGRYNLLMKETGPRKKLNQMKLWLYDLSNGKFDNQYWDDLRQGKVNATYWSTRKSETSCR